MAQFHNVHPEYVRDVLHINVVEPAFLNAVLKILYVFFLKLQILKHQPPHLLVPFLDSFLAFWLWGPLPLDPCRIVQPHVDELVGLRW